MIKGKYVATVTIDFNINEAEPSLKPFDEIRDEIRHDLTPDIQKMLEEEFGEYGKVAVSQLYADAYQVKEESNENHT